MAEKTITYIPPKPQVRERRVGMYCRVSTNSTEQLNSLTAQISAMTHQYLRGMSVIGIKSELERLGLKSPKGNDHWCKRTIDVMLSNEKYMGDVKLLDNGKYDDYYLAEGAHQAIIPKMMFYAVQIEKERRSNVVRSDEEGIKRKNKKYSSRVREHQ